MSSGNHVDQRASKRRRLKDAVDAGASRRPSPSHAEMKPKPTPTNYLLACYMTHEFLTRGTLLGRRFPQKEAETAPTAQQPHAREAYVDLSCLLKNDGVHLPGIVNPTQLARWVGCDT
ncbi:hypothetical protein EJ110_NYTH11906 [Nymphaea thermarum]|nr:hypothetical protein EJ110_NYTH11906 [Nymphaea thermarum]